MFRGTGAPAIRTKYGEIIYLPIPTKGREERYEVDQAIYVNPSGTFRRGRKRFRFVAAYRFELVDEGMMNILSDLDNSNDSVWLWPHIDFPYVRYECDFTLNTSLWQGLPIYDELNIEFRGKHLLERRPDVDSLIGGCRPTRVGVVDITIL